jgi:hypothetical protein
VSGIAFGPSLLSRADASALDSPLIAVCAMGALARTAEAVPKAIGDRALPLRFSIRVSTEGLGSEKAESDIMDQSPPKVDPNNPALSASQEKTVNLSEGRSRADVELHLLSQSIEMVANLVYLVREIGPNSTQQDRYLDWAAATLVGMQQHPKLQD